MSSSNAERLRVIMFSALQYEVTVFEKELSDNALISSMIDIIFVSAKLDRNTASLTSNTLAICVFATDHLDGHMLQILHNHGVKLIALRYAGSSNVDLDRARQLGLSITRVPAHSPKSIAEYTVTLMLSLNRKVHLAHPRARDGNLSLHGLVGFEMWGRTVGIIGTGLIGRHVARILSGFGCQILAYDMFECQQVKDIGGQYVSIHKLLAQSDIISLHAPLVPGTHHMISTETLAQCKRGVHIINTSRGGLVDVPAIIDALQSGQVGGLAMDVYEGENSLFFRDQVNEIIDPSFQLLKSLPNVLITGHQGALTTSALTSVAKFTLKTLVQFHKGETLEHMIRIPHPSERSGNHQNEARETDDQPGLTEQSEQRNNSRH